MAETLNEPLELKSRNDVNNGLGAEGGKSSVDLLDDDGLKEGECGCAPCGRGIYPKCLQVRRDGISNCF